MGIWQEIKNVAKGISEWGAGQGSGLSSKLGLGAGNYASSVSDAVNRTMKSNLDNVVDATMKTVKDTAKDASENALGHIEKGLHGIGNKIVKGSDIDTSSTITNLLKKNNINLGDEVTSNLIKSYDDSMASTLKYAKSDKSLSAAKDFFGIEAGKDFGAWQKAKMMYGDSKYGGARLKATAGVVGGVAVGTRLLSGGNLTTNARGERDIVGIPFI